jgi:PLP dependent protein
MADIDTNHGGIRASLAQVHERIAEASLRAGRQPAEVTLVAVSKTFPAAAVLEAIAAGQCDFGENRVEEAAPKIQAIAEKNKERGDSSLGIKWHLIGHLQSRKVKDAIAQFDLIHSVDTFKLAQAIDSRLSALADQSPILNPGPQSILLECNISGEESKGGFRLAGWDTKPEVLAAFVRQVEQMAALPHIQLRGLMTMAPIVEQPAQARLYFASLRSLRDALRERFPVIAWDHLSMGMSDDFEVAIAEGATLVRIGRAIFGERT